jgi:hypothetical protein
VNAFRLLVVVLTTLVAGVPLAAGTAADEPPPPTIDFKPDNPSGSGNASFTFSDTQPTVTFQCRLDGGGFSLCFSPVLYTGLGDGSHTFEVKALDLDLHQSEVTSYSWTIDTTPPPPPSISGPPNPSNSREATFTFSDAEPDVEFHCRLDASGFPKCSNPRLYSGLGEGMHVLRARAVDAVGNESAISTYTWVIDLQPPETTITSTPPALSGSGSASFTFTSSEGGSTFVCSIDAGGITPCASPKAYTGLGNGSHHFRVQAVDAAGNADANPATYSWQINGVRPGGTDTTPPGMVKGLKPSVGYGVLRLTWRPPSDADFDHVVVFVSTSAKSLPRKPVYEGHASTYTDRRFKNGLDYRYLIVTYDHAANGSGGAPLTVAPSVLLRSPKDGTVVQSPPVLRWRAVAKASFYNVQLYFSGRKILSTWPTAAKVGLKRSWSYGGRRSHLKTGIYRWYVWPGFGSRGKSRYGQLLGQGWFRVR